MIPSSSRLSIACTRRPATTTTAARSGSRRARSPIERVPVALGLPVHRPHCAHRSREHVVLALEPADPAVLVAPTRIAGTSMSSRARICACSPHSISPAPRQCAARSHCSRSPRRCRPARARHRCIEPALLSWCTTPRSSSVQRSSWSWSSSGSAASSRRRGPIWILDGSRGNFYPESVETLVPEDRRVAASGDSEIVIRRDAPR
jgi:hypothetical protein